VEPDEARGQLDLVANRIARRRTGAQWQLSTLAAFERRCSRDEALTRMLARYVECFATDAPVADWPVEG
jgi:hypothetical protein